MGGIAVEISTFWRTCWGNVGETFLTISTAECLLLNLLEMLAENPLLNLVKFRFENPPLNLHRSIWQKFDC